MQSWLTKKFDRRYSELGDIFAYLGADDEEVTVGDLRVDPGSVAKGFSQISVLGRLNTILLSFNLMKRR